MSIPEFSDPTFTAQLGAHQSIEAQYQGTLRETGQLAEELRDNYEENLEHLGEVAKEVSTVAREAAQAAPENADLQPVQFYTLEDRGRTGRFVNNRGKQRHMEAQKGWIIVPSSAPHLKSPKANLVNNSGLGLVLTEDGKLYGYVAQKGLKSGVKDRFEKIDRADIERNTFVHKRKTKAYQPPISNDTFAPRYRPLDSRPTLLLPLDDPANGLATEAVVDQAYDALAKWVQKNLDTGTAEPPRKAGEDTSDLAEETTVLKSENELPAESLEENMTEETNESTRLEKVEGPSDQEKIDQWFSKGLVTVQAWLSDNDLDQRHNPGRRINQYLTVYNERSRATKLLEIIKKARTPDTIRRSFSNEGVDELVTVGTTGKKFSEINPDSPNANEDTVLITYEVPYNGKGASAETVMNIFLPKPEAEEALSMIYNNPVMMREIARHFMDDYLKVGNSWDQKRPDYEKLRAKNGGKSRVVFRHNFHAKPDQGEVREF